MEVISDVIEWVGHRVEYGVSNRRNLSGYRGIIQLADHDVPRLVTLSVPELERAVGPPEAVPSPEAGNALDAAAFCSFSILDRPGKKRGGAVSSGSTNPS